jgi:hypothetical protein
MGLELGGWEILLANDIDEQKKEMYFANNGENSSVP